jgi:hypothetical protein
MYIDRETLRQLVEATQRINEESVKTKIDPKKIKVPYDGKVAKGITRLEFLERVFTSTPDPKKMGTNIVTFVDRKHEERMYQTKEGLWKHFMQDYLDTGRLPSGQGVGRYRMVRVNGVCWGSSMDSTYWKHLAETVSEERILGEEIVVVQGIIPEGGKNERFDIETDAGLIAAFKKLYFIDDIMVMRGMKICPEGVPFSEWSKKPHMKKSRENEKLFGKIYSLLQKRNLKFTYAGADGRTHLFLPNLVADVTGGGKHFPEAFDSGTVSEANSGGMAGAYIRQMAEKNYQKALDAYSHYSDAGLQNPNRLRELEMELDRACERCKQVHAKCCKITEEADPVDEATLMKALRTGDRTDRMKASYRQMRVDAKRREAILRKVNDYGVIPEFDPAVKKVKDPRALEVRSSDELAASHDMSMNALDYGKGTIVGRRWGDPVPKSKAKARADEIKSQSWKRDIRKAQKDREARMQRIRRLGGVERRRVDRKYRPTDDELNYGNF